MLQRVEEAIYIGILIAFIYLNVHKFMQKVVTSRDSFLEIVAQIIHYRVWPGAQAKDGGN